MQLLRNRSTRGLWHPNYVNESFINDKVRLIPRMKDWVAPYPGLKAGLTEYGGGAEEHINGGTGGNTVGSEVSALSGASPIANLHIIDNSIVGVTQNSAASASPDGIHVLGVGTAGSVMIIGNRIQSFVNRAIDAGESACRDNTVNPSAGTVFCTVATGTFGR